MQTNSSETHTPSGNGLSLTLQPERLPRTPNTDGSSNPLEPDDVRISMTGSSTGPSGRPASRRVRAGSHSHSHSHGHSRPHPQHEPESEAIDSDVENGEPSTSFSEFRYLFRWIQKSLPFIIILCAKLIIQHALGMYNVEITVKHVKLWSISWLAYMPTGLIPGFLLGLAVGIGLFTTFVYVNKNIQTQVFLQVSWINFTLTEVDLTICVCINNLRCCHCVPGSTLKVPVCLAIAVSDIFHTPAILHFSQRCTLLLVGTHRNLDHLPIPFSLSPWLNFFSAVGFPYPRSLIFMNPSIEPLGFWEVLWAVGVTNFVVKFIFMGFKCLILMLPTSVAAYRTQVRLTDKQTSKKKINKR